MPFFRVRTAFSGPPVIPHCKDIRFHVIAGYPDYGSSYHFTESYAGGRRRGVFSALFCRPFPLLPFVSAVPFRFGLCVCCCSCRLFLLLLFVSVSASAVRSRFRVCFCPHHPLSLLPSASASAVRFRFRHPVPSPPSFPACAVRFSGPLPGDEKACGHNRAAGFPEQALLPFGERYSASSTNTALS